MKSRAIWQLILESIWKYCFFFYFQFKVGSRPLCLTYPPIQEIINICKKDIHIFKIFQLSTWNNLNSMYVIASETLQKSYGLFYKRLLLTVFQKIFSPIPFYFVFTYLPFIICSKYLLCYFITLALFWAMLQEYFQNIKDIKGINKYKHCMQY